MTAAVPGTTRRPNYWTMLVAVGVVAVTAGLLLPQMLPGEAPAATPQPKVEPRKGGDLDYAPPTWPEAPSAAGLFVRLGVGTAVVLGLCVATLWGGKRWLLGANRAGAGGAQMQLVETLHLGNRCTLHLVQLASRQVLVGADAAGVKSIVPLPESFDECLPRFDAEGTKDHGATEHIEKTRTTVEAS